MKRLLEGSRVGLVAVFMLSASSLTLAGDLAQKGQVSNTKDFDSSMKPILDNYLKIQDVLASDSITGVKKAAASIASHVAKLNPGSVKGEHASHYKNLPKKIKVAAETLAQAKAIDGVRESFKKLSMPMAMWGTMSKPSGIDVVFCSMAKGSWLQKSGGVRNPYYGASMLSCGEVVGGAGHAHPK